VKAAQQTRQNCTDYVALAMMSTAGGSPSRSTVEPAVPPHFGGVAAVAVLGQAWT
jgi:hypothetical protein